MIRGVIKRFSVLLPMLGMVAGCASLADSHYEHTQRLRTEIACIENVWGSERNCGADYRAGWKAGYYDVTTGGEGVPPLFAPHNYWSPLQTLKYGDQKRAMWYSGFQDGAALAAQQPDTHYLKVWAPPPVCPSPIYYPSALELPLREPTATPAPAARSVPPAVPGVVPPMPEKSRAEGYSGVPPAPEIPMPIPE